MLNKNNIRNLLSEMTDDMHSNVKKLKVHLEVLNTLMNIIFIQTALYAGYSEEFILNIINESLKYNLNVNHVDSDKDTIMHTAIYSDYYLGDVERIYDLLCSNGYDCTKVCSDGRNLLDAMILQNQYSKEQIQSFKNKFEDGYHKVGQDNQPN